MKINRILIGTDEKAKVGARKFKEVLDEIVQKLKDAVNKLFGREKAEAQAALSDAEHLRDLYEKALTAAVQKNQKLSKTQGKATKNTAQKSGDGVQYSIEQDFYSKFDAWDGKDTNVKFVVGRTSDVLKSVGMKDQKIVLRSGTVVQKLNKHKEMTREIFKGIPELLEKPIIVQFSDAIDPKTGKTNHDSSITVMGELYAKGKPVLVSVELLPHNQKKTAILDFAVITSAYSKEALQNYLNENTILYIEPNKKRTNNWLSLNRLQLPLGENRYGSIRKIAYVDGKVKVQNPRHMTAMERALKEAGVVDEFGKQHSLKEDSDGRHLSKQQQEYFKDSKVRDADGRLLVMYHGTPDGSFTEFRTGSYFTQSEQYADRYQNPGASSISAGKRASAPKTYQVYLNIKKPFDTRKPKERRIFMNEYYRKWGTGAPLADSGLPDWTDGMDLQEFIEEMGYDYDGLILDEGADGGYGEEVVSRGLSYVVFDANQVKNVDNTSPTNSPDIRYSLKETPIPTREELERKSPVKVVDISKSQTKGTFPERRKQIMRKIKPVIAKPYQNKDTGAMIFLTKKSYTHAFSNGGELTLNAVEHLPELIENAVLTHGEPPTHGDRHADGVYTFFAAAKTDRVQPVKLKVKEYAVDEQEIPENIRAYIEATPDAYASSYDTVVLEVEEIEESPSGSAIEGTQSVRVHSPNELSKISVADLLDLVKGEASKYVPKRQHSLKEVAEDADSAYTEGNGTQYSLYWKPELKPEEWGIVRSVMNGYRPNDTWEADDITVGFFSKSKGYQVFGYYSTDDDALLYAVGGNQAAKDNTRREEVYWRVINNGADRTRRSIDRHIDSIRNQSGNRGVHPNSTANRRTTVGAGGLPAAVSENRGRSSDKGRNSRRGGTNPESEVNQHSLKEDTDILQESIDRKAVNNALRQSYQNGEFVKMDKRSLNGLAKSILEETHSVADRDSVRDQLTGLYTYLVDGEENDRGDFNTAYQRAFDIATEIIEGVVETDETELRTMQELRDMYNNKTSHPKGWLVSFCGVKECV